MQVSKPIRLSLHAQAYFLRRGFTEDEVIDTIRTAPWAQAELGRMQAVKDYAYHDVWNGIGYATKRLRPIFVEEETEVVVVTVYTYYF